MSKTETQSKAESLAKMLEFGAFSPNLLQNEIGVRKAAAEELRRLDARVKSLEFAFNEWHDKTDWVQETAQALELGMHRADVLRARIEALDAENKALREVLQAVEMDVVYVGSGENVLSDATRAKVEAVLGKFGAPQAVTQPVGDDREAFEAWAKSQPMILDLSPRGDGYAGAFAQTTWMGWKARGAVLAPQAAAKNGGAA